MAWTRVVSSSKGSERKFLSEHILSLDLTGLADEVDVGCGKKNPG